MAYIIQIIAVVFIIFAFSRVILRLKDRHLTIGEFFFWSLLWIVSLIIIFVPSTTKLFANMLGIGRGIDVVLYLSIILLFYLLFRLYVKAENIEHGLTTLTREIAISKARKKGKGRG